MNPGNLLIFGDSYSTFEGYIPEGYHVYYISAGRPETDVRDVRETWWHKLCAATGANLVLNESWSGSTICYTGYNGVDCSETSSFICRLRKLKAEGFFRENRIDTVIIFGGTNDSWAGVPTGDLQFSDWKKEDLHTILPAVCCMIAETREILPEARILCIANCGIRDAVRAGIRDAAAHYGVDCLVLDDVDKQCGHPTVQGMEDIFRAVLATLEK